MHPLLNGRRRVRAIVCLGSLSVAGALAQEPALTIGGVADKAVYTDRATFIVPVQAGYDYGILLDSDPAPAGISNRVDRVDYHELNVWRTNQTTHVISNRLVRFIVTSSERGGAENGLPPWTPYPAIPSAPAELAGAQIRLIAPAAFPAGLPIPVVAWVEDATGRAVRVNGSLLAEGHPAIAIRRGVGSDFLAAAHPVGPLGYAAHLAGVSASRTILVESNTAWTAVAGTLAGNTAWPDDSRIAVTNNLVIPAGVTLTVGAGSVVRLASRVDVTVDGTLTVSGTADRPVVFTPADPSQPWGGFLLQMNTSRIAATGTVFTGSGAEANWFGSNGHPSSHRKEQGLLYCTNHPSVTLVDCAAIDLAGQLGHAVNGGEFLLRRFLMQRVATGGEYTGARFTVNDSAFIECPDGTPGYVDGDNDALYIASGTHSFSNTLFGWVKDDAVDSGEDGSGSLSFRHCWFESAYHEGNALSGTGKEVVHEDGVFFNCGQGLEVGYNGPHGTLRHCLATANLTGARFGDNYDWSYSGFLDVTNAILIHNYRDVWGMVWDDWAYWIGSMNVRDNLLTAADPRHPLNSVWQPDVDAARLADFMTVPPDAPVGIGLAVYSNRFPLAAATNGLPLRLSTFTPNPVSVDYRVDDAAGVLREGTVTFTPGETVRLLPPLIDDPQGRRVLRVRLRNPVGAEITGWPEAWFEDAAGTNAADVLVEPGSRWRYLDDGSDQGAGWTAVAFSDAGWAEGPAELGYGDKPGRPEATEISYGPVATNKYITYYFRHRFVVTHPESYATVTVRLLRDDGGVVYLNGGEVFRSNMTNGPVTYLTRALNAGDDGTVFFSTNVPASCLTAGTNVVAVEIHQDQPGSSDLSFDLQLQAERSPALNIQRFRDDWILAWDDPAWGLESTERLGGPWTPEPGNGRTTFVPRGPLIFYRLRKF